MYVWSQCLGHYIHTRQGLIWWDDINTTYIHLTTALLLDMLLCVVVLLFLNTNFLWWELFWDLLKCWTTYEGLFSKGAIIWYEFNALMCGVWGKNSM